MGKYEELIDNLYRLHGEQDPKKRQDLLKAVVTDGIEFYGLQVRAFGIEEFDKAFRSEPGEGYLVRTTAVERQGEWIRCGWELRLPVCTSAVVCPFWPQ